MQSLMYIMKVENIGCDKINYKKNARYQMYHHELQSVLFY